MVGVTFRSRVGAVLCAALLMAPTLRAAPPPETDEARARFEEAQRSYDLRRFDQARQGFAAAYEASPNPAFLFNLGQCERQLGNLDQAAFYYRRYLHEAPEGAAAENARNLLAEVTQKQDALEREAAEKTRAEEKAREAERARLAERSRAEENARRALQSPNVHRAPEPVPFYRTWWFIASAGLVVGGAVGVGAWALASHGAPARQPTLGEVQAR